MARQRAAKKYLSYPKGLNTETSILNPEEGTTADELNMDLRLNKLIRARRLGLEQQSTDAATLGVIIGAHYWQSADMFIVITAVNEPAPATYDTVHLYFHDGDMVFDEKWSVRVIKGNIKYPNFSDIRNRVVITFGAKPLVFAKQESGCLDAWVLDLYFRDFKLVQDGLGISERPVTLSDEHKYNVYNAGWYQNVQVFGGAEYIATEGMFVEIAEYPSNADIVSLGLTADGDGITIFNGQSLETPLTGNSEAPRGHYVYNIREIDRQFRQANPAVDGVPNSTLDSVLFCSTNISGLGGDLLYVDAVPSGVSTDPPDTSGTGGSGSDPLDPLEPPGFWDEP